MSGIVTTGSGIPGHLSVVLNAEGRPAAGEDYLRALRTACHRSVADASSSAVSESQGAKRRDMHRHFDARRQGSEARVLDQASSRVRDDRASGQHGAEVATACIESTLSPTPLTDAESKEEGLSSNDIALADLRQRPVQAMTLLARAWRAITAQFGRPQSESHVHAISGTRVPSAAARKQASPALGFREFTVPRRTAVGDSLPYRAGSAAHVAAMLTRPCNDAARP